VQVKVDGSHLVQALDAQGRIVWQRDLEDEVLENRHGSEITDLRREQTSTDPAIVRAPWGQAIVLSLRPVRGPGYLLCLDGRGHVRWRRTLRWIPPVEAHSGRLKATFALPTGWTREGHDVLAVGVRDADWSSTAIEFFSTTGESLGAYYHPGQLEYQTSGDVDGDGRGELVLIGKNNPETHDLRWLREDPGDSVYVSSVVVLDGPRQRGQAYPWTRWEGLPRAREKAYLLVPPLRRGQDVRFGRLEFGAGGQGAVELVLSDGRIYYLDARLHPLSCVAGDRTLVQAEGITRPLGPLAWLVGGVRDTMDVPIRLGS